MHPTVRTDVFARETGFVLGKINYNYITTYKTFDFKMVHKLSWNVYF